MRWERGLHQKELGGIRGRATAAPTSGLLWQHPGGRPRIYLATNILRRGTKANHGLFTHRIQGTNGTVYLPTFTIKSTIHVGKYTSPMDPMGKRIICINEDPLVYTRKGAYLEMNQEFASFKTHVFWQTKTLLSQWLNFKLFGITNI